MVNYNLGKIYQIVCYNTGKVYIGSTCETTIARRLTSHLKNYRAYVRGKTNYVCSFEIIKENNYKIELIKHFPCETREELNAEEGKYIRSMECVNKSIPGRTYKEYYEDNRDRIIKRIQNKNLNNKDIIKKRNKEYRDKNQDKMVQYGRMNRLYKKTFKELCNIII